MLPVLKEHGQEIGYVFFIAQDSLGIYVLIGIEEELNNVSFSIGYKVLSSYKKDNIRIIKKFKIYEVSVVKNPAQKEVYCERISRTEFNQFLEKFRN